MAVDLLLPIILKLLSMSMDAIFSFGLNLVNTSLEDVHVGDISYVFFNIPLDPPLPNNRAKGRLLIRTLLRLAHVC